MPAYPANGTPNATVGRIATSRWPRAARSSVAKVRFVTRQSHRVMAPSKETGRRRHSASTSLTVDCPACVFLPNVPGLSQTLTLVSAVRTSRCQRLLRDYRTDQIGSESSEVANQPSG